MHAAYTGMEDQQALTCLMLSSGKDLFEHCALLLLLMQIVLLPSGPALLKACLVIGCASPQTKHEPALDSQAHWTYSTIDSTSCQRAYRSGGMHMSCGQQHITTWSIFPAPHQNAATTAQEAGETIHLPSMPSWTINVYQRTRRGCAEP